MAVLRRVLVLFALAGALLFGAQAASADIVLLHGGANNIVSVSTNSDGMILARGSTQVSLVAGPSVGNTNIADAETVGCITACHATAVAVQAVFIVGSPQFYTPGNFAGAVNGGCVSSCVTFAFAWQYLVQVSGPVHLSPAGEAEIQDLRQQISDAAATVVNTLDEATALCLKLKDLTSQLKSVVDNELLASGVLATGTPNEHVDVSTADIHNPTICP